MASLRIMKNLLDKIFTSDMLSVQERMILVYLEHQKEIEVNSTQQEIADAVGLSKPGVQRIVKRLDRLGIIQVERSKSGRRVSEYKINQDRIK